MSTGHYRPPLVTLVIPVLADAEAVARLLRDVQTEENIEVIVVDGGSDERLTALARERPAVRLLRATPGRAHQMNVGAAAGVGEWLLFLHADSTLPAGWRQAIAGVDPSIDGGWFRFALDDAAWQARVIERLVAWRVRWLRLPYGDQGLFIRRTAFEALGGFRELPFLEDVEFVRRLVRSRRVTELPLPLLTSARRWRRDGWFRGSSRNIAIVGLYFAGVAPERLARWYRRTG